MVTLIKRGSQHKLLGSHVCYIKYGYEIINKLGVSFVSVGVDLEVLKWSPNWYGLQTTKNGIIVFHEEFFVWKTNNNYFIF